MHATSIATEVGMRGCALDGTGSYSEKVDLLSLVLSCVSVGAGAPAAPSAVTMAQDPRRPAPAPVNQAGPAADPRHAPAAPAWGAPPAPATVLPPPPPPLPAAAKPEPSRHGPSGWDVGPAALPPPPPPATAQSRGMLPWEQAAATGRPAAPAAAAPFPAGPAMQPPAALGGPQLGGAPQQLPPPPPWTAQAPPAAALAPSQAADPRHRPAEVAGKPVGPPAGAGPGPQSQSWGGPRPVMNQGQQPGQYLGPPPGGQQMPLRSEPPLTAHFQPAPQGQPGMQMPGAQMVQPPWSQGGHPGQPQYQVAPGMIPQMQVGDLMALHRTVHASVQAVWAAQEE